MHFFKKIIYDFHIMNPIYPLCAMTMGFVFGVVTLLSSACHPMYHILLLPRSALPFWMFGIIGLSLFVLQFGGAGMLFAFSGCMRLLLKPLLYYLLSTILLMLWYHTLFRSLNCYFALLMILGILLLEIMLIAQYMPIHTVSCLMSVVALVLTLHLIWLNIGIIFLN